jgi:hypothetical protein
MNRVNLCDITQEPTDEDLAELMEGVRKKAIQVQQEAALKLKADLQEEIRKAKNLHAKPR